MKPAKIAVVTLFLLMAIGGISGVMLAGYSLLCVTVSADPAGQTLKRAIDDNRRQRHQQRPCTI